VQLVNQIQGKVPFLAKPEMTIEADVDPGIIDISLECITDNDKDTVKIPLMIFEFGMKHNIWWRKFGHGIRYIHLLYKQNIKTTKPLLMVIITIEPTSLSPSKTNTSMNNKAVTTKMGLFYCYPRWNGEIFTGFRISIVWNSNSDTLLEGSKQFGKLLEVATIFNSLKGYPRGFRSDYENLSSNCCKIGNTVRFENIKPFSVVRFTVNIHRMLKSCFILWLFILFYFAIINK
jgi:hypothetical protein